VAGSAFRKEIVEIQKRYSIAYYISAHGYGHGVRSCSIIRAINEFYPHLPVQIVSGLPSSFLGKQLDTGRNPIRAESFDIGMIQIDSIRVDVPSTLGKIKQLYSKRKERVEQEAAYLKKHGIGLIVVDIPALPIEAAAVAGIPRIAVGNFAWDWIYSEFLPQDPGWLPIIDALREEYAKTDLLLRLPFCDKMNAFPCTEDIPLVASPGKSRRTEIAGLTRCDPAKKWVLLSFATLEWNEEALRRVASIHEYEFFTVRPLQWQKSSIHALDPKQIPFSDVLASMDAVISKPGFGILSDCVANGKPLIYADRSNFLEYQVLVTAIKRYIKHVHIPSSELYRGDLSESLDRIWKSPEPPEVLPLGGGRIAAHRIARLLQ
jgi:L-arabinokinase